MPELLSLHDYELAAQAALGPAAFDYYAGGAMDEITLRENRAGFDRLRLRPRVLVDVSCRQLSTTLLGRSIPFPVLIAPTALHGLAHPDGEVATARAAGAEGITLVLSTVSNRPLEAVRGASTAPLWFQLYVYRDLELSRELVQRVEAAGFDALVLTVDAPVLGSGSATSDIVFIFRRSWCWPTCPLDWNGSPRHPTIPRWPRTSPR